MIQLKPLKRTTFLERITFILSPKCPLFGSLALQAQSRSAIFRDRHHVACRLVHPKVLCNRVLTHVVSVWYARIYAQLVRRGGGGSCNWRGQICSNHRCLEYLCSNFVQWHIGSLSGVHCVGVYTCVGYHRRYIL